jgi:hypothetical protein
MLSVVAPERHSGSLQYISNYDCKKFYSIGARSILEIYGMKGDTVMLRSHNTQHNDIQDNDTQQNGYM